MYYNVLRTEYLVFITRCLKRVMVASCRGFHWKFSKGKVKAVDLEDKERCHRMMGVIWKLAEPKTDTYAKWLSVPEIA